MFPEVSVSQEAKAGLLSIPKHSQWARSYCESTTHIFNCRGAAILCGRERNEAVRWATWCLLGLLGLTPQTGLMEGVVDHTLEYVSAPIWNHNFLLSTLSLSKEGIRNEYFQIKRKTLYMWWVWKTHSYTHTNIYILKFTKEKDVKGFVGRHQAGFFKSRARKEAEYWFRGISVSFREN